jgi:hypothetical protein
VPIGNSRGSSIPREEFAAKELTEEEFIEEKYMGFIRCLPTLCLPDSEADYERIRQISR